MSKLYLYLSTVSHLKACQIFNRICRKLGWRTPLRCGHMVHTDISKANTYSIPALPELDFDPVFLERFDVDAILNDRLKLLHHEERVNWGESWHACLSTPLWRFNLHYHEYLLPLAKAYIDGGDARYLEKAKGIIDSWIASCPLHRGGAAWDPYVISMRAVNWLAFLGEAADSLAEDEAFVTRANESLVEQYAHLSQHLERDLLANHYLENLKTLVILACYFKDDETLAVALPLLKGQIDEQILPDGMHFELSPMYHKVVLEDLLRTSAFLEVRGYEAHSLVGSFRLQDMCDTLWSLECNTDRTPLFNDSGNNVAKSRDALLACARERFGITPQYRKDFPDAGYYLLEDECAGHKIKVIFDAGKPSPGYASGHMHCDALSFELFVDGKSWIVNSGTYAYQDENRLDLKRTAAHSAPQVEDTEQAELWASFRVARMSSQVSVRLEEKAVFAEITDYKGNRIRRLIRVEGNRVHVTDSTPCGKTLSAHYHGAKGDFRSVAGAIRQGKYCPDFGQIVPSMHLRLSGSQIAVMLDPISFSISYDTGEEYAE